MTSSAADADPGPDCHSGSRKAGDGAVCARLARRTAAASWLPLACALAVGLTGWLWPGWATNLSGMVLCAVVVGASALVTAVVARRTRQWRIAAAEANRWTQWWRTEVRSSDFGDNGPAVDSGVPGEERIRDDAAEFTDAEGEPGSDRPSAGWVTAACGDPTPLHSGRGTIPLLRRQRQFPPHVLPLRTVTGPLASGFAVIVHGRPDRALPERDDRISAWVYGPRGPILIGRHADGAVFAADRWTVGTG